MLQNKCRINIKKLCYRCMAVFLAITLCTGLLNSGSLNLLPKGSVVYAVTEYVSQEQYEISAALKAGIITEEIAGRTESELTKKDLCYMLDRFLEKRLDAKIEDILKDTDILIKVFDNSGAYGNKGQLDLSKTTLHTVYGCTVKDMVLQGHEDNVTNDLYLPGLTNMLKDYCVFRKNAGSDLINREDAAELIWQIARMIGFDRDNYEQDYVNYGGYRWEDTNSFAAYFVCGTVDNNGNRIMTAESHDDTKVYFEPRKPMTTDEGIKAVYRLYNTDVPKMLSLEGVPELTVSKELQSYIKDSKLPNATYDNLPYWTGVNLTGKDLVNDASELNGETIHVYSENQIRYLSELGFNCVRVMLGYRMLSSYYDEEMIILKQLENIDDLIKWGAKYNVHIMLDMQVLPGWGCSTNGLKNRDIAIDTYEQELSLRYWKMFAKRYNNIPNNILSFNLLNEPYPVDDDGDGIWIGDEEFWNGFLTRLTEGIRSVDRNRLIIADSYVHRVPFQGLRDDKIAQSVHIYDPSELTCNTYAGKPPFEYTGKWPIPIVDHLVYSKTDPKYIPYIIEGDFPAGTRITIDLKGINSDGNEIKLAVDMDGLSSKVITSEVIKKSQLEKITLTTTENANSFNIYANPVDGGFVSLSIKDLVIAKPNGTVTDFYITALPFGSEHGDSRGHRLIIYEDGTYGSDSYIGNDQTKGIQDAWYHYLFDDYLKLRTEGKDKVDFLCGEFGIIANTEEEYALKAYDTLLSYMQKNKIGWQVFAMTGNFGFLYSGYKNTVLQEGYPLNKARLHILQRYMSKLPITEEVKNITISKTSLHLKVGDSYQLTAKVSNEKTATNPRIGWFTTNRSVVMVDSEGKLEVKRGGTATITAEAVDGSGVMASCVIEVEEEAKPSLQIYSYKTKDNYNARTNAQNLGVYSTFEEVKKIMDKLKDKNAYYRVKLMNNVKVDNITLSSYAKEIMICGRELEWKDEEHSFDYSKLSVGGKITANTQLMFQTLEISSQKENGIIYLIGNGNKVTLNNCKINGKLDGGGSKGNSNIHIKEFVKVTGELRNITHLTIGVGIKVNVDKNNHLDSSSYEYEVALLRMDGRISNITTLSSYEGRIALTSSSEATFNKIDGVMLFIYMGKAKQLSKVTFDGDLVMYYGLKLIVTDNESLKDAYSAKPLNLKNGDKLASISPRVSRDGFERIGVSKDTTNWEDIQITLSGDSLLVGAYTTYRIVFNANGGKNAPEAKQVIYGGTYGELLSPVRAGYTFAGWYTKASGGTLVKETTILREKVDKVLYAHWVKAKSK